MADELELEPDEPLPEEPELPELPELPEFEEPELDEPELPEFLLSLELPELVLGWVLVTALCVALVAARFVRPLIMLVTKNIDAAT